MKTLLKISIKYLILFLTGGLIYITLELTIRDFSHITMYILGGICFILIGLINKIIPWSMPILFQALIGGLFIITPLELIFGLLFNQNHAIWDYSNMPLNFMGQICAPFSLLWCVLAIIAIILDDYLRYFLFLEEKPHYKLF